MKVEIDVIYLSTKLHEVFPYYKVLNCALNSIYENSKCGINIIFTHRNN